MNISFINMKFFLHTGSYLISRTLGKEMGKPHVLGTSVDSPWVKFPDNFCLEELVNNTCGAPAGVSAIVYDTNPLVRIHSFIFLQVPSCQSFILIFRVACQQVQDFQRIQK